MNSKYLATHKVLKSQGKIVSLVLAIVAIFGYELFSLPDRDQPQPTAVMVHICGWKYYEFAKSVFPEAKVIAWEGKRTTLGVYNVVITSAPCKPRSLRNYPGNILYVDGEPGQMRRFDHPRVYYLGVTRPPADVKGNLQIFHVAHSTLFHPYSATDFLQPRSPRLAKDFLIYINSNCVNFREEAFSSIVQLASRHGFSMPVAGGKCHSKHPETSVYAKDRAKRLLNIVEKFSSYRFALVMENTQVDGYITEKIANAMIAGAIPIYYGTLEVFNVFNKRRFIFYDIKQPDFALEQIRMLESNHSALRDVLRLPILADGETSLRRYFSLSDDVGGGDLKYRIRRMIGLKSG
jgi:hypothetical protein|tara:strand:- start:2035 stop:3081 length:1047 start_codon:yes stop_codon:yes gene_type:complete